MTGVRIGEAQALEWEKDIDLRDKTLTVSKSINKSQIVMKEKC